MRIFFDGYPNICRLFHVEQTVLHGVRSLPGVYPLSTVRLGKGIGLRLNLLCVKLQEGDGRMPGY